MRDLINRHLLDRGYTLLCQGESLTVVNIKKLDAALVPRVDPKELDRCDPYEFVKVSFPLDWPHGRNSRARTHADDEEQQRQTHRHDRRQSRRGYGYRGQPARNPRGVEARAIGREPTALRAKKFKLHYARAEDVRDELQALVGGEAKSSPGHQPQNPEQSQQAAMMRAMQQQAQQSGQQGQPGQPGQPPGGAAAAKIPTAFVVNPRENSILVTAPPDKMAIIVQVIKAVDVPADSDSSDRRREAETQIYRLTGIEPEPVVKTLEEIGHLSPTAHLEVDKKNKLIIADASPADHATIRALVDKLSGSDRSFEVIRLRRRRADSVAASIEFMMGIDSKKKKTESHHWLEPVGRRRFSSNNDKTNDFRVARRRGAQSAPALGQQDRTAGGARPAGETWRDSRPSSADKTKRVMVDGGNVKETKELLERIRAEWPLVAPNPKLFTPLPVPTRESGNAAADRIPKRSCPRRRRSHCRAAGGNDGAIDGISPRGHVGRKR